MLDRHHTKQDRNEKCCYTNAARNRELSYFRINIQVKTSNTAQGLSVLDDKIADPHQLGLYCLALFRTIYNRDYQNVNLFEPISA